MEAAEVSDSKSAFAMARRELLFKILVIGELGAGKTSFIKRYVHQFFSEHYRATIGVDFALKVITNWDNETERFGNMTRVYYKDAVGAFLVFDLTRADSFNAVEKWKADLDSKVLLPDGRPIPCVLLANKSDMDDSLQVVSKSDIDTMTKEKSFAGWFPTSAKEGTNVEEAANFLVQRIIDNEKWRSHQQQGGGRDTVDLGSPRAFAFAGSQSNGLGRRQLMTQGEEALTTRKECKC